MTLHTWKGIPPKDSEEHIYFEMARLSSQQRLAQSNANGLKRAGWKECPVCGVAYRLAHGGYLKHRRQQCADQQTALLSFQRRHEAARRRIFNTGEYP